MPVIDSPRRQVSSKRLAWLESESQQWQDAGAIDPAARRAILERYTAESSERRGMLALILVAVGMCSVGLLLLVGYNWDQIPRAAKLAIVIGAVVAAFGASAIAYAKGRLTVAEVLAFAGTLLFGNAIWLVAQVLHIQGRYPDAFLWWGLGVLACAWLVRSKWVGVEAAALLLLWVAFEGDFSGHPSFAFLAFWPLAIAVAYSLRSSLMIRIAGPAAALWVFFGGSDASHSAFWLGGIALVACAFYSAGRWHQPGSPMRYAWEGSGLLILLLAIMPLMATEMHTMLEPRHADALRVAIAAGAVLAIAWAARRPSRTPADNGVLVVAGATAAWTMTSWWGVLGSTHGFAMSATVLFSILALVMAVSLIRTALVTSREWDLGAGVMFAVVFLIVRWVSVIENLLWSGLLLLAAGAGLLIVARLWRGRARVAAGRVS